ncbi:hypothetical protein ACWDUI_10435, partial [Streptosporangium sandarakinum]
MRIHRMTTLGGVVAMLLTTLTPLTSLAPAASAAAAPPAANAACPEDTGQATCLLRAATGGGDRPLPNGAATTGGGPLTAKDLQEAYRLPADWLGGGQTVAIVSPYDNVTAEDELAEYRKVNGMPPCDADFPCF